MSRSDDFKNHVGTIFMPDGDKVAGTNGVYSYGAESMTTEPPTGPDPGDPRPLIDRLHEATFTNPIGLQWCSDLYGLRTTLRKAHCFNLDAETSAMIADFSIAVADDLDGARQLAVPPFPTTWFQIDNRARIFRVRDLGVPLTRTAAREDTVKDVGWLITTIEPDVYCATYVCALNQGMLVPPLSFCWSTKPPTPRKTDFSEKQNRALNLLSGLVFGVKHSNVEPEDAWLEAASFQTKIMGRLPNGESAMYLRQQEIDLMQEISGELRHIFGLLIALGAGQLGAETKLSEPQKHQGPKVVQKGKELFPLEYKTLTIKLGKRHTVAKVVTRAITGVKHRYHDVRGHFRTKYNADGSVKWRIPIMPHHRGDKRLGTIEKTYRVKK